MDGAYAAGDHGHPEISRLIEVLEGVAVVMPSGVVVREGGLIHEVTQLNKQIGNGGVKIQVPPAVWVAIVVAVISGAFSVWAAIAGSPVVGG
jgi:hypothetical protein